MQKGVFTLNLNDQQRDAVTHYGTPQVIIAGAGTGKTTVIIEKIRHLISSKRHRPRDILALTFTNKAANEMRERFGDTPSDDAPTFGTFHSFCFRWLKQSPALPSLGMRPGASIISPQQQRSIIQKLVKHTPLANTPIKRVIATLSKIKQHASNDQSALLDVSDDGIDAVFEGYNRQLRALNSMDFDDILVFMERLLRDNESERHRIQSTYQYIIVDEYQDTNSIQNKIAVTLAQSHKNICVVGDFDQTIYSWRGARIENLLLFKDQFPNTTIQKLEQNYRSTKEILLAANQLIDHNQHRQPKQLIAHRTGHSLPHHVICYNEYEEAEFIIQTIQSLQKEFDYSLNNMAILYRTNQQSRVIEECLTRHQIPHHILGGISFYHRLEIKVAIAYLNCLHNIDQPLWFEQAMLTPARGIGAVTIQKLFAFSRESGQSLSRAVEDPALPVPTRMRHIMMAFVHTIQSIQSTPQLTLDEAFNKLCEQTELYRYIATLDNPDDRQKNIEELKSKLKNTTHLSHFLDDIALFQMSDDTDKPNNGVQCLTLHSAKGLEFPVVFIPGVEDRLMPLLNSESIEEERRLAYVGITRGKDHVYLLSAYKRTIMGNEWYHNISTFTKELNGRIHIFVTRRTHDMGKAILFKLDDAKLTYQIISKKPDVTAICAHTASFQLFQIGDVVLHNSLGTGTIQGVSGDGESVMYDVRFACGKKKLMAKFAKLTAVHA